MRTPWTSEQRVRAQNQRAKQAGVHEYKAFRKEYVVLYCEGCGDNIHIPGLALEKAQEYIDEFYQNTGYAYID